MSMKKQTDIVLDFRKDTKNYINCITFSRFPYFDTKTNKNSYKARPILIIGCEKERFPCDVNILPVSTISSGRHIHEDYDKLIPDDVLGNLKMLSKKSYIRVHKQSTVNSMDIANDVTPINLKEISSEFYDEIMNSHSSFVNGLFDES